MSKLNQRDALAPIELLEQFTARARALVEQDIKDDEAWWRTYVEEWAAMAEYVADVRHTVATLSASQGPLAKTAAARKGRVHPATIDRWLAEGTPPLRDVVRGYRPATE